MANKMTDHEIKRNIVKWGFDKLVREGASSEDIWIYLHVSGMVIKVDGELPKDCQDCAIYESYSGKASKLLKDGWGATIPIIEEE